MQSKRAKIIATLGPASEKKEVMVKLIEAGADVFRLNFSHGTHEDHLQRIAMINEINDELGTNVSILQDLQGPKIRIGKMENGEAEIQPGQQLIIGTEDIMGTNERVSTTYKPLATDVVPGDLILVDDGKIQLKVVSSDGKEVTTEVVHGGMLKSRKGINLPNTAISAPSLTEKDREDLEFGLEHDVQWVALSFVRNAKDITELRDIIKSKGKTTKIIAKIEKPEAVAEIDGIIEATDAIMVARGDLGVEVLMEDVPMIQKRIVSKCNKLGKPVIIATQMLESMIENPRPTRAEANDVANSILDGADTVMLSAESASGSFPVESVQAMAKCIMSIEDSCSVVFNKFWEDNQSETAKNDMLVKSACQLSKSVGAKAIIGMTKSGYTAFSLAKNRPEAGIFIFTSDRQLLKTMNLVWGVTGFYYEEQKPIDETFDEVVNILKAKGLMESGDVYIHTASMPLHWQAHTNMMKLDVVK
ncbi:pyruvate kinase [Reichenbachiella carrageenanivorans]|uniref:Pyruvate kinase n=1 Tax=Reichenbachiella carrageenanivorans TaxID=2979869 RepID=A0ABY6CUQ7_9BACT|nr:pyruvate kinase [Reichenbachiella carrageenanivorans]UXX77657.1 pyruvate kinase [Reichenbachiella carrageenanivorans]